MVKSEHSAKPCIEWGLVGLSAKLDVIDKAIHTVYHASLVRLWVNPKMKKEFCMLLEMYQGLGMFNLNIDGLGTRIFFLRQRWNMNTPISKMLRQAFKAFQMNVGLEGNIFVGDFTRLCNLSEDCWFKETWKPCHRFKAAIIIHECYDIPMTRRKYNTAMK